MKHAITAGLILALIAISIWAPVLEAQPARDAYNNGFEAGLEDGSKDVGALSFLFGALLGPISIGYSLLLTPNVPESRLQRVIDEGDDFVAGYKDGYRRSFRRAAIINNFLGWSSWLIFAVVMELFDEMWDSLDNNAHLTHNPVNTP